MNPLVGVKTSVRVVKHEPSRCPALLQGHLENRVIHAKRLYHPTVYDDLVLQILKLDCFDHVGNCDVAQNDTLFL